MRVLDVLVVSVVSVASLSCAGVCSAQECSPYQAGYFVSQSPGESDWFGLGMAIGSGTILVGAPNEDTQAGIGTGGVSVYEFNGVDWVFASRITASDAGELDQFGRVISARGSVAIIGAPGHTVGLLPGAGSAYVYRHDGTDWVEEAHLIPPQPVTQSAFGKAVAIDGDVAVVGMPNDGSMGIAFGGSMYIFRFNGADWVEEAHFFPTQPGITTASYGSAVAVDGDVVVVGAFREDETGFESGGAYVYRFDGAAWTEEQRLVPNDAWVQKRFGWTVAVRGERVVIGAPQDFRDLVQSAGAAYVFEYNGSNWGQTWKLAASDAANADAFGTVSMGDDLIVVGAQQDDTIAGADSGSAYIFRRSGMGWVESGRLYGAALLNTGAGDKFGVSIAISGSVVAIGAFGDDVNGVINAGSARLFNLGCPAGCQADITGDGVLDNGDIGAFITAFLSGNLAADFTGDGILDNGDIGTFVTAFLAGC